MVLLKLCFCLTFLAVVLSDETVKPFESAKLTSLKFLNNNEKFTQKLKELANKLTKAVERDEQVAILNDYTDELLANVNEYITSNALDPVELPGFDASFKWTIFTGWVILENGWLSGLSSFQRRGDVVIKYEYPNVKITMPLGFSRLRFNYDYEVKFMYLGPTGGADGKSDGNKFTVDLNINMITLRAKLEKFNLNTLGSVSFKFNGSILTDWIVNLAIAVIMPILKPILGLVIQSYVVDGFEYLIDTYNGVVCTILADCPQLASTAYQLIQ